MGADPCLLIFVLILGAILSDSTYVIEANGDVSGASSSGVDIPSFNSPYTFKAVSKRRRYSFLHPAFRLPPGPSPNRLVHVAGAPYWFNPHEFKYPPPPLPSSPSPPPPPSPLQPPLST